MNRGFSPSSSMTGVSHPAASHQERGDDERRPAEHGGFYRYRALKYCQTMDDTA